MQARRHAPAPLSDELLGKPAPVLLGALHHGPHLCVKNTFLELPSSLKGLRSPMLTAPAMLNKRIVLPARPATPVLTPVLTPESQRSAGSKLLPKSPLQEAVEQLARELPQVQSLQSVLPGLDDEAEGEEENEEVEEESDDDESPECQQQQVVRDEVPRPPAGALHPSIGSMAHASGACKRCCFFPRGRCMNGYECEFCHYSHDNRKRKNKKKGSKKAQSMSSSAGSLQAQVVAQSPMVAYVGGDAALAQVFLPMQGALAMQGAMPMQGSVAAGQLVVCAAPLQMCAMPAQCGVQQAAPMGVRAAMIGAGGAGSVPLLVQAAVPAAPQAPQLAQLQQQSVYRLPPAMSSAQTSSWAGQGCAPALPPAQPPRVRLALASQNLSGGPQVPPLASPRLRA